MCRILLILAATMNICAAQAAPTFKGHTIGETREKYVEVELAREHLATSDCISRDAQKAAAKRLNQLGFIVTHTCERVASVLKGGRYMYAYDFADFENDKLVFLSWEISFIGKTYVELRSDVIAKLGKPSESGTSKFQNRLGGTFEFPWDVWRGDSIAADLRQQKFDSATLTIADTHWLASQATEKKNSLD
jgi:hypothetical protein